MTRRRKYTQKELKFTEGREGSVPESLSKEFCDMTLVFSCSVSTVNVPLDPKLRGVRASGCGTQRKVERKQYSMD